MLQKPQPQSPLVRQSKLDETAKEKLLMIYQGIFRHNIKEFAEMVIPKQRTKTNYSK